MIRRRALQLIQDPKHPLLLFAVRAEELGMMAEISRVSRSDAGDLLGYQRPEVRRHVQNIVDYIQSSQGKALFPNSIILALSSGVKFTKVRGPKVGDGLGEAGTIVIPLPKAGQPKPAWVVDGQQRALALSRCNRPDFAVPVAAFLADDINTQREQFLRINSTKPLPRGLITELLPKVASTLPANLAARRVPAALCELLNQDPESPFYGLIQRASTSTREKKSAIIADNTIMAILQESFSNSSGCLFIYRNLATGETDFDGVRRVLLMYWRAVKETFPNAWGLPPTQSRLMHGTGLRAMGKLMDRMMSAVDVTDPRAPLGLRHELGKLRSVCAWTSGLWGPELDSMKWNELQNTPQHVRLLSNYIVRAFTFAGRSNREVLPAR